MNDADLFRSMSIRILREYFMVYPPRKREEIRADVRRRIIELRRAGHHDTALERLAMPVYGVEV